MTMAPRDYISEVTIVDTFGIREISFKPKSVTRIKGRNGSGKTSIVRGVLKVFEGGTDASIIRKGSLASIVTIKLASGYTITKTSAKKKRGEGYRFDTEVLDPEGVPQPAPQTLINQWSEALAVDPGAILRIDATTAAGRKALLDLLLRINPLTFTPVEISQACSYRKNREDEALTACAITPEKPFDLTGMKQAQEQVRELRRRVGATRDETEAAVTQMTRALGQDDGRDHKAALTEAENLQTELLKQIADGKAEVEAAKREALARIEGALKTARAEIDAEIDGKIAALELERRERHATALQDRQTKAAREIEIASTETTALEQRVRPELDRLAGRVAELREKAATQERAAGLKPQIDIFISKSRAAAWQYDQLSNVIAAMEKLVRDKLESSPVPGLEVADPVTVDGIEWPNVNLARRVDVVMQLCAMCAGKLGFMVLDDCEHLDTETRAAIEKAIIDDGWQLIEAVVTDSPLCIETAA